MTLWQTSKCRIRQINSRAIILEAAFLNFQKFYCEPQSRKIVNPYLTFFLHFSFVHWVMLHLCLRLKKRICRRCLGDLFSKLGHCNRPFRGDEKLCPASGMDVSTRKDSRQHTDGLLPLFSGLIEPSPPQKNRCCMHGIKFCINIYWDDVAGTPCLDQRSAVSGQRQQSGVNGQRSAVSSCHRMGSAASSQKRVLKPIML